MKARSRTAKWLEEARAHVDAKRYDDALAYCDRVLAVDRQNTQALIVKARALWWLGRYDETDEACDRILAIEPDHADAYLMKGWVARSQGHDEAAIAHFARALALQSDSVEAAQQRALALDRLKRYEEAITAAERALELDPTASFIWAVKANGHVQLRQYDGALQACDQVTTLSPDNAAAWNNSGYALGALERHEEALAACERAIALDAAQYTIWSNKAAQLSALGRHDEAVAALDVALGLDDRQAFLWRGKGYALRALKRHEEAVDCLRRAVALDPQDASAWQNMGYSLEALDKYDEALAAYKETTRVAPDNVNGWLGKSNMLFRLERYEEALAADDDAWRLSPSNPDVIAHHDYMQRHIRRSVPDQRLRLPDGRWLGYVDFGDPDGTPVIGCHGTPGSRLEFCEFEDILKASHVRLIVPDRPGYGLSDPMPRRRILDFCEDVAVLADHLGLERFAILSVSGGGPYALACAYRLAPRVTRVALVSSPAPVILRRVLQGISGRDMARYLLWRWLPFPIVAATTSHLSRHLYSHPKVVVELFNKWYPPVDRHGQTKVQPTPVALESIAEPFRQGGAGWARDNYLFVRPWGFRLEDISTEVYLWQGEADTLAKPQDGHYLAAALPHCHATFLPGEGHRVFEHHAHEILIALRG